ncbi:ester cyclase [Alphaproteobacteria bacterium]|nr:ester cyclase [Alphaproteobacteria bacterium]
MTRTIEEHKITVRRFYEELWNKWDYAIIGDILTQDVEFHGSLGAQQNGHQGFLDYAEMVRAAFPDFTNSVEELIAEGDKVAACMTYRGTQIGRILDIEPTGRRIRYIGTAIFVFRDGLISKAWVLGDRLELLQQLSDRLPDDGVEL